LHYWELANVLRTYVRRAEIDAPLATEIYALHLDAPLEVAEPERSDVLRTALELDATAYDAVFIALSRSLGVPLLTAERKTTPWVVKLGRLVETVRG
jgi:predicted nucleic acid-binding protein